MGASSYTLQTRRNPITRFRGTPTAIVTSLGEEIGTWFGAVASSYRVVRALAAPLLMLAPRMLSYTRFFFFFFEKKGSIVFCVELWSYRFSCTTTLFSTVVGVRIRIHRSSVALTKSLSESLSHKISLTESLSHRITFSQNLVASLLLVLTLVLLLSLIYLLCLFFSFLPLLMLASAFLSTTAQYAPGSCAYVGPPTTMHMDEYLQPPSFTHVSSRYLCTLPFFAVNLILQPPHLASSLCSPFRLHISLHLGCNLPRRSRLLRALLA